MKTLRRAAVVAASVVAAISLVAACSMDSPDTSTAGKANSAARANVKQTNGRLAAPVITGMTEYHNYIKAQKVYDNPNTIIWCTTTWGNASAPLVTIPVAGKLTSSTVSLFPSTQVQIDTDTTGRAYNPELPSVDSMFHGTPPPYRYGFTPGGQYVDFFNMPTLCTTALTKFQRQSTKVSITEDQQADAAQTLAEKALAQCNKGNSATTTNTAECPAAQDALENALGATGGN